MGPGTRPRRRFVALGHTLPAPDGGGGRRCQLRLGVASVKLATPNTRRSMPGWAATPASVGGRGGSEAAAVTKAAENEGRVSMVMLWTRTAGAVRPAFTRTAAVATDTGRV